MGAVCDRCGGGLGVRAQPPFGELCPTCLLVGLLGSTETATGSGPRVDVGLPLNGRRSLGDFELLSALGSGGMGTVYRARQPGVERVVALKVLTPPYEPRRLERFRREVRALGRLRHPHVVRIHGLHEADGFVFYGMDLIEGRTLAEALDPLPPFDWVAQTLAVVARAVHSAHEAGIVHRDLKPSNILLEPDDTPYVADFGLAADLGLEGHLTRAGTTMGTGPYMAPEQIDQEPGAVDARADVYALGAILYECLVGAPPFLAEDLGRVLALVRDQRPTPPRRLRPEVPPELERICLRALEKLPERRQPSAAAFAEALEAALVPRAPAGGVGAGVAIGLVVVSLVAGGAVVSALRRSPPQRPASTATPALPAQVALHLSRGRERRLNGDLAGALDDYTAVTALAPGLAEGHWRRGSVLAQLGRLEEAGPALDRAVELAPAEPEPYNRRGFFRSRGADLEGAEADYDRALALDPHHLEAFNSRAVVRLRRGNLPGAEADLRRALELEPRHLAARSNLAQILLERGDVDGALALLADALALDPDHVATRTNRAALLGQHGRHAEALRDVEHALQVDPRSFVAWRLRAVTHQALGELEQAEQDFERALGLRNDASTWNLLGILQLQRGLPDAAEQSYTRAIDLAPGEADAWMNRGSLRQQRGELAGARADYDRALALQPAAAGVYLNRALLRRREDPDGAREDARRGLACAPTGSDLERRLRALLAELGAP